MRAEHPISLLLMYEDQLPTDFPNVTIVSKVLCLNTRLKMGLPLRTCSVNTAIVTEHVYI